VLSTLTNIETRQRLNKIPKILGLKPYTSDAGSILNLRLLQMRFRVRNRLLGSRAQATERVAELPPQDQWESDVHQACVHSESIARFAKRG
jgi:hypothetical protein